METIIVKEEIYSEESSEVNVSTAENGIDALLINSNATVPYPFAEKVQESINDSGTSFCFVGIKMEEPDDYESEASSANSETIYTSVLYPSNHERECNVDDQCLEGKLPTNLRNTSCIKMKMECTRDIDRWKSDFQTNDTSVTIYVNDKCDFRSVDMGFSSNEFIRGIECQEYPILGLKEEEEKTDKQVAVNTKISVKREMQDNSTCSASADLEYNMEEYLYNSEHSNMEGNGKEENKFPVESTVKMESKEEIDVCLLNCFRTENMYMTKARESKSQYYFYPIDFEVKDSCDELSQLINAEVPAASGRNVLQNSPNLTFNKSFINDHCEDGNVKGTEDLEIQFESICDVSEFDIKAEKPFGSGLISENVDELDMKSPVLRPLCVILNDESVELDGIDKHVKNSLHVANSSRLMLKEEASVVLESVSLREVYPSHQTEIGKEALAFNETSGSSITRMKSVKYEMPLTKEYFNRLRPESAFNAQTKSDTSQEHTDSHTGPKPNTWDFCNKTFQRRTNLKRHNPTHTGEKPFSCGTCKASFRKKGHLNIHIRTHTGEKPFLCDVCHVSFAVKWTLKEHLRTHTEEKPFLCGLCDVSLRTKGSLKAHMLTHAEVKPFSCGTCEASFSQHGHLKRHIRTHTGEKPFTCATCKASFSQNCDLKKHVRRHSGEKPFLCDVCCVSFREKAHLKVHMRTHTGEKPYTCVVCEASFSVNSLLKRHMRTHSSEKFLPVISVKHDLVR